MALFRCGGGEKVDTYYGFAFHSTGDLYAGPVIPVEALKGFTQIKVTAVAGSFDTTPGNLTPTDANFADITAQQVAITPNVAQNIPDLTGVSYLSVNAKSAQYRIVVKVELS